MIEKNKIHVILLTTYFPPVISVASNRMIAFAKYLDKTKFNISVIALDIKGSDAFHPPDNVKVHYVKNNQFIKLATFNNHSSFVIHKLKAIWNKFVLLTGINEYSSWKKNALAKAKEIISSDENTVILSSFPVEAPIELALDIKALFPKVKVICDLRDALSANPFVSDKIRERYRDLEKKILQNADIISTVSEPIKSGLEKKVLNHKVALSEIRNGFDFEIPHNNIFNEIFTISYVGTFHGKIKPYTFFHALKNIKELQPDFNFRLNLIGIGHSIIIPDYLKENTIITFKVSHQEALNAMFKSDVLLLLIPATGYKGIFSGKIFEYLGSLKPIIAAVDKDDVAAQLIKDCNAGFIASFEDEKEIAEAILNAYKLWKNREVLEFNKELILEHHRSKQVEKLNQLILSLFNE